MPQQYLLVGDRVHSNSFSLLRTRGSNRGFYHAWCAVTALSGALILQQELNGARNVKTVQYWC